MALFMVMTAIAVTFILGAAIVANSAIQAQVAANQAQSYQADCLAESGINLADYYLLNPANAPVLNSNGYYPGETGISLDSSVSGTINLTVAKVANTIDNYLITSTGVAGSVAGSQLSRKLTTQVVVRNATITQGIVSNASLTLPANTTITGNVIVNGTLALKSGATITGSASAVTAGTVSGTITGGAITLVTSPAISVTPTATLNNYTTYEYYNGTTWSTYSAENISLFALFGNLSNIVLVPSVLNPGGVFYYDGNLTLGNNVTIDGTLLLPTGNLTVDGKSCTITPSAGYPGLIIEGNLVTEGSNNLLTVNGLTWVSGILTNSGTVTSTGVTIKGALMFGGSTASISAGFGNLNVTYTSANLGVTHLNTVNDTIVPMSWSQ